MRISDWSSDVCSSDLAVAPAFARRGQGTIINVSSVTALAPELFNGVYAASKAYVLTMTQALHHELAEKGVRVQAVLPGVTSTTFWATAGLPVANQIGRAHV